MTFSGIFSGSKNQKKLLLAVLLVAVGIVAFSITAFHGALCRHLEEMAISRLWDTAEAERRLVNICLSDINASDAAYGSTEAYEAIIFTEAEALMRRQGGMLVLAGPDGRIVAAHGRIARPEADGNLFEYLQQSVFYGPRDASRVKSDFLIGYESTIVYSYGGQKMIGAYLTVTLPGCYLFCAVPYDSVEVSYAKLGKEAYRIWLGLLGAFLLLLGYMLLNSRRQVAELAEQQKEICASDARYKLIMSRSKDIIIEYDLRKGLVMHCENAGVLNTPELRGTNFLKNLMERGFIYPEDAGVFYDATQRVTKEEEDIELDLRLKINMGGYNWYKLDLVCIRDSKGTPWRVVAHASNIDRQKRDEQRLQQRAVRDPLTKLYNKTATTQEINRILEQEPDVMHAFIIVDVDDFKQINDTYGHLPGDQVLTRAAKKLTELFRSSDVLGRIGGDEFVVFCRNVGSEENALRRADEICHVMQEAGCCEGRAMPTSASVGVAIAVRDGDSFDQLYCNADAALYAAKRGGKNSFALFDPTVLAARM